MQHQRVPPSGQSADTSNTQVIDSALVLRKGRIAAHVAHTSYHRLATDQLIKELYEWRGYQSDALQDGHPGRKTFLATSGAQSLGTLSIKLDSEVGLTADGLYKPEIDLFRRQGFRVCEMGKLAIAQTEDSRDVVATLFNMAYIYTHVLNRSTHTFIEVNPRHVSFYRRLLGFEVAAEERFCSRVSAPAILLRLDLAHAERQIEKLATRNGVCGNTRSRSLYASFLTKQEEKRVIECSLASTIREVESRQQSVDLCPENSIPADVNWCRRYTDPNRSSDPIPV